MYNLYQSELRKDIQTEIYQKPFFTINLFGREYFGLIKTKKIGPVVTKRYQIMGVELPDDKEFVRLELEKVKRRFKSTGKHILFQLGIINEIISFENVSHRDSEFKKDMKQMRLNIRSFLQNTYNLRVSFRENMPQANIIYDITKSDEQLLKEMNSGCKERVKKSMKKDVQFRVADPTEYEAFYHKWKELAGHKGFNIIPYDQYQKLVNYLVEHKRGDMFISEYEGEVLAGSICFYDEHRLIYMYGFGNSTNKKLRNLGGHHYLKYKIFGHARDKGFTYVDMLGGAPTGFDDHPLIGVSKFKESLGGIKVEQYGNYDIILSKFWYTLFKWYTKLRKH